MNTDQEMQVMKARLQSRADRWSPNGLSFLAKRTNARSPDDRVIVEQLLDQYTRGDFGNPGPDLARKAAPAFGKLELNGEEILLILLGRAPYRTQQGIEAQHKVLTPSQTLAQETLARALTGGKRFLNKEPRSGGAGRVAAARQESHSDGPQPSPRASTGQRDAEKPPQVPATVARAVRTLPTNGSQCARARARLVSALRNRGTEMNRKLAELKAEARQFDEPDFFWRALVQSFATMGNARGFYGLVKNPALYAQVTYEAIKAIPEPQRRPHLDRVLRAGKVRRPGKKAEWLAANFSRFVAIGGPEAVKCLAESKRGTAAKIAFARSFDGIGPKYARNLWMDVYHPDFRQSIAVDDRIKKISQAMGCTFSRYEDHEQFYLDIARDADLEGWELDRLIFNFLDHFLSQVQQA